MKIVTVLLALLVASCTSSSAPQFIVPDTSSEQFADCAAYHAVHAGKPCADRPQLSVGERWTFSIKKWIGEFTRTVTKIEPDGKIVLLESTNYDDYVTRLVWSKDLNFIASYDAKSGKVWLDHGKSEYAMYRFPLYIGKTWTEDYGPEGNRRTIQVRVIEHRQLLFPQLGEKVALFCLENKILLRNDKSTMQEQYCYSPAFKTTTIYAGSTYDEKKRSWELIKYKK